MKILKELLQYSTNLMPDYFKSIRPPFLFLILVLFSGLFNCGNLQAQRNNQNSDTLIIESGKSKIIPDTSFHDPRKAIIYSAILPGLGQIYNKKVWKVPIIYAGIGTFVYYIDRNQRYYLDLKTALMDETYIMKYFPMIYTDEDITWLKDNYKRWRDMSVIGTVGFYVLQIVDASVDAYMFNWDVGEDISLRIEPANIPGPFPSSPFGLRASISF